MNKLLRRPPLTDQGPIYFLMVQVHRRATQGGELYFALELHKG